MVFLAICRDAPSESGERARIFEKHVGHMLQHLGTCLLGGPTARADDVSGTGDDPNLAGSLFFHDVEDADAARAIVDADPFAQAVWDRVDLFAVRELEGAWLDAAWRPKGIGPDYRCYVALGTRDAMPAIPSVSATLAPVDAEPPADQPEAVAIFHAASLEEARQLAPATDGLLALPVAIGRWVGLGTVADVMAARK